jgi:hypothetical protein
MQAQETLSFGWQNDDWRYAPQSPSENEQFSFTVPDTGDGTLLTYIVSNEETMELINRHGQWCLFGF